MKKEEKNELTQEERGLISKLNIEASISIKKFPKLIDGGDRRTTEAFMLNPKEMRKLQRKKKSGKPKMKKCGCK